MTTTTNAIDLSRDVEAVCRRTGTVIPMGRAKPYANRAGLIQTERAPCSNTSNSLWYADGRDYCHLDAWTLRNVAGGLAIGTEVRLGNSDRYRGKVVALGANGIAIVAISGGDLYQLDKDLRDKDGDQWRVVRLETVAFFNVYADGIVGVTAHKTLDDAAARTQYGRVAIGAIQQVRNDDGVITAAKVVNYTPRLRTRDGTTNPFA